MEQKKGRRYQSSFRDQKLAVWEAGSGYSWTVTNSKTGETARGEAVYLDDAMVAAAQAAQADWGTVKWRGGQEDE
jgi:hypothetical protein